MRAGEDIVQQDGQQGRQLYAELRGQVYGLPVHDTAASGILERRAMIAQVGRDTVRYWHSTPDTAC